MITRKCAINQAIRCLPKNKVYVDAEVKLQEIYDELPRCDWTKKAIDDAVIQYIKDNNIVPRRSEFKTTGYALPTIRCVEAYYGDIDIWLNKNYPNKKSIISKAKSTLTRKDALKMVISYSNREDVRNTLRDIAKDLPLQNWSKKSIFDAVKQFVLEENRNPTTHDFKYSNRGKYNQRLLPPHPAVKTHYGITLLDFLDKYFPTRRETDEERLIRHLKDFKMVMETYNPRSLNEYNAVKPSNVILGDTLKAQLAVHNWLDIIEVCEKKLGCKVDYTVIEYPNAKVKVINTEKEFCDVFSHTINLDRMTAKEIIDRILK